MTPLFQQLVLGLLIGGLYGLAAAGLSLVFGVLKVLNVAHGQLIMLGGYGAFWLFALRGLDPFASLAVVIPAALVGLEGKAHRLPAHLTLIDRKRLELARALATAPRLLLLDEFMAGLNPAETESAMALIRRIQDEGVTLLMVEHIVWALMDLSRRLIVLSAGEKIADGPPDAVAADPTVIDAYLGGAGGSARRA